MPNQEQSCRIEACRQQATGGKGYCARHYSQWRRGRLPKGRFKTCRIEGCHRKMRGRGRCEEHLSRDYPGRKASTKTEAGAGEASAN